MAQPLEAFRNAFKIPELKSRIIFTLVMLAVYRLGAHVPTPGIDGQALSEMLGSSGGGLLSFYDMFTGGAFSRATIMALGIMPYISASIIMQLLTAVVPYLEQLQREGEEGRKKITAWTRYGTIALCIVQSIAIAHWVQSFNAQGQQIVLTSGPFFYFLCVLSFTTGTAFLMWIGEQISEYGVGNGISLLIFTSIISDLPSATAKLLTMVRHEQMTVIGVGFLVVLLLIVVAGVILLTVGQRRVPVQYPRQTRGRHMTTGGRNYLPLRVNQAGVIPIIFASSLLMLPSMVGSTLNVPMVKDFIDTYLDPGAFLYNAAYAGLIIFFCFFYTAITFNPIEMADNLKKYGGVIMGVRPGKATADYLNKVMTRITLVGALALAAVALLPTLVFYQMGIYDFQIAQFFGGTSLLILVGVALDTVRQIETHLTMRNYDGFMKGRRLRSRR